LVKDGAHFIYEDKPEDISLAHINSALKSVRECYALNIRTN